MANSLTNLSVAQLKNAVTIKQQIEKLEKQLSAIMGGSGAVTDRRRGPRTWTMSAEARAKIAAAQRARWAKQKAGKK